MKRTSWNYLFLAFTVLLAACSGGSESQNSEESGDSGDMANKEMPKITLTPLKDSPTFPDANLTLIKPMAEAKLPAGNVNFEFGVENYYLGEQTSDAADKGIANSGNGQHIHLILNNGPYSAHYDETFDKELEAGHYVALAFLSRSYHESLKNAQAAQIWQFTLGDDVEATPANLNDPHMFYSRPKGTYTGDDTKKVLLDFYLANTTISPTGNTVRATINGEEFIIAEWVPHLIEGMPMGENTIKLELLDADGNLVESPFNPVTRTVTLAPATEE